MAHNQNVWLRLLDGRRRTTPPGDLAAVEELRRLLRKYLGHLDRSAGRPRLRVVRQDEEAT